jgi:hypothetical protein
MPKQQRPAVATNVATNVAMLERLSGLLSPQAGTTAAVR